MPIKWKKLSNAKPQVLLDRIQKGKSKDASGKASFSGFEIFDAMPALESLLSFPNAAEHVDKSLLVWRGVCDTSNELTQTSFLETINRTLKAEISTAEKSYRVLTSISLKPKNLPIRITRKAAIIHLLDGDYPKKFQSRNTLISSSALPSENVPVSYCYVIIDVKAKSERAAMSKALRALDLERAVWCLSSNARIQIIGQEWDPINRIRLGGVHTVHSVNGARTGEQVWFEPNFVKANLFNPDNPKKLFSDATYAHNRLAKCQYSETLSDALLRYVRALDERDQNSAFIRLWSALEALLSPNIAQYDDIIRRGAFLFKDVEYHRTVLEHLRQYRNTTVHSGEQNQNAKVRCYQAQRYFFHLFRFHLQHVDVFKNLTEANEFLDMPTDKAELRRRKQLLGRVERFVK